MVIGVPWLLLELKHSATPEVMAFGKEFKIHQVFQKYCQGLAIVQCGGLMSAQTLIVFDIFKLPKRTKNNQKDIKILKLSQGLCFMCFKCKTCKNKEKTYKVCSIGSFSPPSFKNCQLQSLGIYFERKSQPKVLKVNFTKYYTWVSSFKNFKFSP